MTRKQISLAALVLFALVAILVPFAEARYYHPTLGRFINRDPNEYVDGLNLYNYTGNNPIILTDAAGGCSGAPPQVDFCEVESVTITDKGDLRGPTTLRWIFDVEIIICGNPMRCGYDQSGWWRRYSGNRWLDYAPAQDPGMNAIKKVAIDSYTELGGYLGRLRYSDSPGMERIVEPAFHHDTITVSVWGSDGSREQDTIECGPHAKPAGFVPPKPTESRFERGPGTVDVIEPGSSWDVNPDPSPPWGN